MNRSGTSNREVGDSVAPTAATPSPASNVGIDRSRTRRRRDRWFFFSLLAPATLVLGFVLGFPIARAIQLSLVDGRIGHPESWLGLRNYRAVLSDDLFWRATRNTIIYTGATVLLSTGLGLLLALLMRDNFRGRGVYRGLLLVPWLIPPVTGALLWQWIFNSQYGVANQALLSAGIVSDAVNWFAEPRLAMCALIVASVWQQFPFAMLMIIAALQGASSELREAARCDGCSPWQEFRHATWPAIRSVTITVSIVLAIFNFQNFATIQIMTKGGPYDSTTTLAVYLYRLGFQVFDFGEASAAGVVISAALIVGVWIYYRSALKVTES